MKRIKMTTVPLKVVFLVSGPGSLLESALQHQGPYRVTGVVSDHQCLAIDRAQEANIGTEIVPLTADREAWNIQLAEAVAQYEPDLVVSAGFMKILGQNFLSRFHNRVINTHPALLPSFPGAHGVREALAYGVKVTGCTVHFVDSGVDTGKIIAQEAVRVAADDDEHRLHERIKTVERKLLVDVLNRAEVVRTETNIQLEWRG